MIIKDSFLHLKSRKSFHGYPPGMAQLIDSPTTFRIQPMQIDTKNRFYNGTDFKPGILPRSCTAPSDATYSGLLECPCTTRIHKEINVTYSVQNKGVCKNQITNSSECFKASHQVFPHLANETQSIVNSNHAPTGCSILHYTNGSVAVVFNEKLQGIDCGKGSKHWMGSTVSTSTKVSVDIDLNSEVSVDGKVRINITGPSNKWFGVGFGANTFTMSDKPYAIIVDGNGKVTERKLGNHDGGTQLSPSLELISNNVVDDVRNVIVWRSFKGKSDEYYTFNPTSDSSVSVLTASGEGPDFSYHGPNSRGGSTIQLIATNSYSCVCNSGIEGSINGIPFKKICRPEPFGDLIRQNNPTCSIQSYQGGLVCCHHQNVLLDADQIQPEDVFTYHMKFRFYFQSYASRNRDSPSASHKNLIRLYYQTEAYAGEYDIPKADPTTPRDETVHIITARFKVQVSYYNTFFGLKI